MPAHLLLRGPRATVEDSLRWDSRCLTPAQMDRGSGVGNKIGSGAQELLAQCLQAEKQVHKINVE